MSQGYGADYLVKATGETEITKFLTQQSLTSGTDTKTFTIPAGVKRFSLHINRADLVGGSDVIIQIGGASGLKTSGYRTSDTLLTAATSATGDGDDGWHLPRSAIGDDVHGTAEFWLQDPVNHIWAMSFMGADLSDDKLVLVAGTQNDLGEELTTVAINPNTGTWDGTDAFVGCSYENPNLAVSGNGSIAAGVTDVFINGTKQASTSGTEVEFTLPSGIKEFKLALAGVSASAAETLRGRFSVAGAYVSSTTYEGNASYITGGAAADADNYATNVGITLQGVAAEAHSGLIHFTLLDAATNTWCWTGSVGSSTADTMNFCCGSIILTGELDGFKVYVASGTLDAGSVNIQFDNQELDLGSGVISGGVVGQAFLQDGDVNNNTSQIIAYDDSIPQNTEGAEVMTVSYTPKVTGNKLKVELQTHWGTDAAVGNGLTTALFQDSTASALAATSVLQHTVDYPVEQRITFWLDAVADVSTTFKVRIGAGVSSDANFNAQDGGGVRRMGGAMASFISVTEYKA